MCFSGDGSRCLDGVGALYDGSSYITVRRCTVSRYGGGEIYVGAADTTTEGGVEATTTGGGFAMYTGDGEGAT